MPRAFSETKGSENTLGSAESHEKRREQKDRATQPQPFLSDPRRKPRGRRVAVREVAHHRLDERLQDAVVADLAEQAQRAAADVLVRVHQVVPQRVAHQDHLLAEVARLLVSLLDNLPRAVWLYSTRA